MFSEQIAASRSLHVTASSHLDSTAVKKRTLARESTHGNICRICHGGESKEQLVKPCTCKGSLALVHHSCLERWLRESLRTDCEVCRHKYEIIRKSNYNLLESIYIWIKQGAQPSDIVRLKKDLTIFSFYTPATIGSVYILLQFSQSAILLCQANDKGFNAHAIALTGMLGIAFLNLSYLNWIFSRFFLHFNTWKRWWLTTCEFKLILPVEEEQEINISDLTQTFEIHTNKEIRNASTSKKKHKNQKVQKLAQRKSQKIFENASELSRLSFVHADDLGLMTPIH